MPLLINPSTQSSIDLNTGEVIYFGLVDFLDLVKNRQRCFLCGKDFDKIQRTDLEHVLPDWLIRYLDIASREFVLANKARIMLSRYKVKICERCNKYYGDQFEIKLSGALKSGFDNFLLKQHQQDANNRLLYKWLCFIFLKMHIKDIELSVELDHRKRDQRIADNYYWNNFYLMHHIIRSKSPTAVLDDFVYGTLLAFKGESFDKQVDRFDMCVDRLSKCVYMRIEDLCLFVVFDDSRMVQRESMQWIGNITGPLSAFQAREVFCRLAYTSLMIQNKPEFYTVQGLHKVVTRSVVSPVTIWRNESDLPFRFGDFFGKHIRSPLRDHPDRNVILEKIIKNDFSFL